MKINRKGIELIKSFESCKLKAYKLQGEKYYTIGYGYTFDPKITKNTVWSKAKAEYMLLKKLKTYENYVNKYVPLKLTSNQFSALVSYTYNRGLGGLLQLVRNSKTVKDYSENIVKYWGSAKKYKNGLIRRRKAEQKLFNTK